MPNEISRTADQVRFTPHLPWEAQDKMYRQAVSDGGLTMSYGTRAREVLACIATAVHDRIDESTHQKLAAIGDLLIVWEGCPTI